MDQRRDDGEGRTEALDAERLKARVKAVVERVPPKPVERRRGERRGLGARHDRRARNGRRDDEAGTVRLVEGG